MPEEPGNLGASNGGSCDIDSAICQADAERALQALPSRQADRLHMPIRLAGPEHGTGSRRVRAGRVRLSCFRLGLPVCWGIEKQTGRGWRA